ncbi:hypothetical protein [Polaromonas naphthalenivorans]|uniref:hypothetical protein n=1 Tax=Polaromonas naphthalenivorans TaxID=216465 RepID=UPI0012ED6362|nr:hypothetical protein [Polaromonas naphthalenivorans]
MSPIVRNTVIFSVCVTTIVASAWLLRMLQVKGFVVPGYVETLFQILLLVCIGGVMWVIFSGVFAKLPDPPFIPDPLSSLPVEVQERHAKNACSFSKAFGTPAMLVIRVLGAALFLLALIVFSLAFWGWRT